MAILAAASVVTSLASTPSEDAWPLNGRTASETHFSPLADINTTNVTKLGFAWEFSDFVVRGRTHRGVEASPLMSDGVLYFTGPWSVVYAVDARSGRQLWQYDPGVQGQWVGRGCCDAVNRGVALWKGKIYVATLDGYLVALDAKTGSVLWRTDTFVDRKTMNYTITGAPRIAGRSVVIGNGGAEMAARGYVSAYDLDTGKLSWRFFTVPGDPTKGPDESDALTRARATWSPNSRWDLGGGGTAWDSMVYDAELDTLYVGVGNGMPHPVWLRSPGGGDNLYLSSIVALDAKTGKMRWYYQTTPGDSWDYTATQNIILADLELNGRRRQVLMQAPKNGFFYVLDRRTGELLSAEPYTNVTWAKRVDLKTGRPEVLQQSNYSKGNKLIWPSQAGGHNWMPMSYSEALRLVYIPSMDSPMIFGMPQGPVEFRPGARNEGDSAALPPFDPKENGLLKGQPETQYRSVLKAWDPAIGKVVWQAPGKAFWAGGVLSTAGGLVFQGAADGVLYAYDARTGKTLAALPTGTGIMAAPISYKIGGVQYIAVLAGFGGAMNVLGYPPGSAGLRFENYERLLVFKLGGGPAKLPPERQPEALQPLPAPIKADAATIAHGRDLYLSTCTNCHGFRGAAYAGAPYNGYPNLWNLQPDTHSAFNAIVWGGAFSNAGMPSFKEFMSEEDVEAIHAFLVNDEIEARRQTKAH
jgi:quinohemoprotein ethanol dehydrogenase